DWMIRAYAIGVGTTASGIVLFPIYLLTGEPPTGLGSDLIFFASWIGSIAAGEWVIRRLRKGRAAPSRRAPPLLAALCVLALGMLSQPGEAHAEGLRYSVGILGGAGQSPFDKDHTDSAVFPDFSIEGARLSLGFSGLTFDVVERGGLTIAARLAPRLFAADPSDVAGLEQLERDIAIEAGLSARFASGNSGAEIEVLHDISDTHGGTAVNAWLSTGYSVSDRFRIGARAVATWMDADLATYSYGVFASEADGSLAAYRVGASVIPSIGLHASYAVTDHASLLVGLETTFLPKRVTDSPIVKRDILTSVSVGMRYDF
ncbi:MAG: MipA/OmpV family protein, partial [Jannaschia sp.]